MKYVAKDIEEYSNVKRTSPVREFFELLLKSAGVLLLLYWLSGLLVNFIAPKIPSDLELKIGTLYKNNIEQKHELTASSEVQDILDNLIQSASSTLPKLNYKISITESQQANAFALPGGEIVVTSGLLKEISSENELAMILAHELGHYANRDHLKGLGRGLLLALFSCIFVGTDATTSGFLTNSLSGMERKFSQKQEIAADLFALDLVHQTYHNVTGATDFFKRVTNKDKTPKFLYFLATHPHPEKRYKLLQKTILDKKYIYGEKIPLTLNLEKADGNPETP